jgi:hypothetical protein
MTASNDKSLTGSASPRWLQAVRIYLGGIAVGNLIWESVQLPLYTLWITATPREQVFAVVHCTIGDGLIALSALTLALVIVANDWWPAERFWPVAGLALATGVAYTVFSEWLNVAVRAAWAYSDLMPVISIGDVRVGLSPLLQWIVVPAAAFVIMRRATTRRRK